MSLYLQKRNNTYYFRIRIPQDLQHWFSGREIKKSLKTNSKSSARVVAYEWQHRVDRVFAYIRSGIFPEDHLRQIIQDQVGMGIVPSPAPSAVASTVTRLSSVAADFMREQVLAAKWTDKTRGDYEKVTQLFIEFVGDIGLEDLDRATMVRFMECLARLPANLRKKSEYQGMSLASILEMQNLEPMSAYTANKYMSRVSSMLLWCVRQGLIDRNPAEGLALGVTAKEDEERHAYSVVDLSKIRLTLAEYKNVAPERYFVPLMGAFSGARLNEICQLHVSDVKQVDGVWCFDINDEGVKRLKNKASRRVIPVHPELVRLGLLDHVERMRSAGNPRVWMNLEHKRDGYSHDFGKWYQRFNRKRITTDPKKVFHSFRHLVADTLKQKGVAEGIIAEILGHSNQSITTGRYGKRYRPSVLLEALEMLTF